MSVAPTIRQAPQWSKTRWIGTVAAIMLFAIGGIGAFMMVTAEPSDITGEWSGEGWDKVALSQTSATEYAGTYTDTLGKEPGKIELKWSRIERRYNGTWSEGKNRFGKISVRQVGDEIRGAWTTDRKSEVNPGTPELADLLWVRAKADPQGKDAPHRPSGIGKKSNNSTWAFGPVIDRTLYWPDHDLGHNALRLDDGHIFNLPKTFTSREESKKGMLQDVHEKWLNQTKVHFAINYLAKTDQWEMKLRNVKFAELAETPSSKPLQDWKTLSANEVQERFPQLEWKKATNAETDQKENGFYSLIFIEGMPPPMTFAFETSDGHRGVLQFMGYMGKGPSGYASIRYKQIQPSVPPANVKGDDGKTTPN
jgi:hypothetical protein